MIPSHAQPFLSRSEEFQVCRPAAVPHPLPAVPAHCHDALTFNIHSITPGVLIKKTPRIWATIFCHPGQGGGLKFLRGVRARPAVRTYGVGRDGEQVHMPRGLAGRFETAHMDHVHE